MKEWKTYTLGNLCTITSSKRIFAEEYQSTGVPFYRGKEVIELQKGASISSELFISEERYNEIKNKHGVPRKGEMLLTSVGTLGIPYVIGNERFYFKDGNLTWFRNFNEIIPQYLYYWFLSPAGRAQIDSKAIGSTQKALTIDCLSKFEIVIPPLKEQKRTVSILESIDNKIRTNQAINDNLEQQIQTLYREWFIDNPKTEWATIALSEVATFVSGYSYKGNELVDSSETAMATIKNFERNGGFKLDGYKPVSPSLKLKEEQHAELFDILVAHTDLTQNAEVIGNAEIILSKNSYNDVIFSMDLVKVVAKESFPYQFLLALLLKNPVFKSHCIGYVNGTTVLHMNKRALPDFNTQIPTCEDAARMNEITKSIFTKMSENLSEIANLTKLRDSLLPKLMSGELKINEIDC